LQYSNISQAIQQNHCGSTTHVTVVLLTPCRFQPSCLTLWQSAEDRPV